MKKFDTFTGSVVPIPIKDIDTDMIIPANFLTSTSREGYGKNVFIRLREERPDFPLNKSEYKDSSILLAGSNFGCGSSREHAVWALQGWGFKTIIAESFADIFSGNALKNGLLIVALPKKEIEELFKRASESQFNLTVNLSEQTLIDQDGKSYSFVIDPFRKHCILEGVDDLSYLLAKEKEIKEYFAKRTKELRFNLANI